MNNSSFLKSLPDHLKNYQKIDITVVELDILKIECSSALDTNQESVVIWELAQNAIFRWRVRRLKRAFLLQ